MKRLVLPIILIVLAISAGLLFSMARRFLGSNQPQEPFIFPYVQNFDDVNLRTWLKDDGVWTIRDQALLQTVGGENVGQIHLPFSLPEGQPYHLSTFISLKRNTKAAGVAFNSQYPDLTARQHRVYLAREDEGNLQLIAGYTEEDGSFVPQSQVPLSQDLDEYRLDLFVFDNTYLVQLNGQRLIERRPLFYKDGLTGFISEGSAIFDTLKISAADSANPEDLVYVSDFDQDPGGEGWVPFSGDWRVSEGWLKQLDPNTYDSGIGYEASSFQNYVVQARFAHQQGVGAGLLFNMPSPYQINGAHLARYSDETDAIIWGYYDSQGNFVRQGYAETQPPGEGHEHLLQVFSGEDSYDVFLDDRLLARDVPLQVQQGHIGLTTSRSAADYSLVEVFPLFGDETVGLRQLAPVATAVIAESTVQTESSTPTAPTLIAPAATPLDDSENQIVSGGSVPYIGSFTGDFNSSEWQPISGDWRFENGSLMQTDPDGFDYAVVNTSQAYRNYSMQVSLKHQQGYGAGVLFNMPYKDRLHGAHLVRYSDRRPDAIFWGYFDNSGKFIGQGYADVAEAGIDKHIFRIESGETAYDIYLDENLIASDLPLQQDYGYVGLLTTKSSAAYDQVQVNATAAPSLNNTVGEAMEGFTSMAVLSGQWRTEAGKTIQEVTDEGDYILNLGTSATEFSMEAEVTLPENSTAGAGFIFHMPEPGSRRGAQIVRLIDGGQGLFWGRFDETSAFQGRGSAKLDQSGSQFLMRLEVSGDSMDLFVNGERILDDVPIERAEGWLGLISFAGPVTFENLKVNIVE